MRFGTWARNVREMRGGKRGRNPVFSSAKGYPMAIERELSQYVRRVLDGIAEKMAGDALSGLKVARDDLSDLNGREYPLPDGFGEKMLSVGRSVEIFSRQRVADESFMIVGERYIPPAVKEDLIFNWCENMQVLCKTTTAQNKAKISQIVGQGVARGENLETIRKEISKVVPEYTRQHAELVARTEIGKLNGAIKRAQYEESGIEYYKWMSGRDDRVRPTHAAMNGVICSLSDPDVYYEETPDGMVRHQRTGSMVHLHPGDDFQCRCTMVMWDPEIDGKYEVKETPKVEPEKKEPTALELEREKTAKAEAELEKARAEKEAAERAKAEAEKAKAEMERKAEILRRANERHAKRTPKIVEKIQEKWRKSRVKAAGIIPQKAIKTKKDFQNIVNAYFKKYPLETTYTNLTIETKSDDPFVLMWANHSTETIGFNTRKRGLFRTGPSSFDVLKNAVNKIREGLLLEFDEEYSLESFYHEINHTKAKKWAPLKDHGNGDYKRTAMETINQFVSRHTYVDFVKRLGGVSLYQKKVLDEGIGYSRWLRTFRGFIANYNLDEKKVLQEFSPKLFDGPYDALDDELYAFFQKHSGTQKTKDEVLQSFENAGKVEDFMQFLTSGNNP